MLLYISLCRLPLVLFISIAKKIQSSLFTPSEIYTQWWDLLLFSPGWTVSSFSPSSWVRNASVLSLSLWSCAGLTVAIPCFSCSWEPMDVYSTRAEQMGGITSFDLLAMLCLKQEFFLDEEYWEGAGWVKFLINTFKVRKKWKATNWILFWASRFSQRICSLKYYMVYRYYG